MNNHNSALKSDYDFIWQKFNEKVNYLDIVQNRELDRKLYHEVVLKYSSRFSNPKVLELGCGTGVDINIIKKRNPSLKAYASDISKKSIQFGQHVTDKFSNKIEFCVADTLALPFKNSDMNVVFSQGLIEHFEKPIDVVAEQTRILDRKGFLIINVPQKFTGYTLMKKIKMRSGKWKLGWEIEFSYKDLQRIGSILDLSEKEVFGYQYWRSWHEPSFVIKDIFNKFYRRIPSLKFSVFRLLINSYDSIWSRLEKVYGHYFLQNIVIVFQKK